MPTAGSQFGLALTLGGSRDRPDHLKVRPETGSGHILGDRKSSLTREPPVSDLSSLHAYMLCMNHWDFILSPTPFLERLVMIPGDSPQMSPMFNDVAMHRGAIEPQDELSFDHT